MDFANPDEDLSAGCSSADSPKPKWGRGTGPRSSAIKAATTLAAITPPASSASRISGRSLKPAIATPLARFPDGNVGNSSTIEGDAEGYNDDFPTAWCGA